MEGKLEGSASDLQSADGFSEKEQYPSCPAIDSKERKFWQRHKIQHFLKTWSIGVTAMLLRLAKFGVRSNKAVNLNECNNILGRFDVTSHEKIHARKPLNNSILLPRLSRGFVRRHCFIICSQLAGGIDALYSQSSEACDDLTALTAQRGSLEDASWCPIKSGAEMRGDGDF